MTEVKKIEDQRFEFILYINKNIVCQRFFSIRDFNEDSAYSIDLKYLMDRIVGMGNDNRTTMGMIPSFLKKKSMEYLWKYYRPYEDPKADGYRNIFEKEDTFDFEIRVDKSPIAQSTFSGNFFPQHVRYHVDIKELIPNIIYDIKDTLSKKKYVHKYANIDL